MSNENRVMDEGREELMAPHCIIHRHRVLKSTYSTFGLSTNFTWFYIQTGSKGHESFKKEKKS